MAGVTHGLHELVARSGSVGMSHVCVEHCVASPRLRNGLFWQYCQIAQGLPPPLGAPFRQTAPPLDAVVKSSPDSSARPPSPLHLVQPRLHNAAQVGVDGPVRSVAATVRWGASRQRRTAPPRGRCAILSVSGWLAYLGGAHCTPQIGQGGAGGA